MAEKQHPYASPGAVIATVNQLRKSFPAKVTADTLKKLNIAPNNESYVINTLRFIGVVDQDSAKTEAATGAFSQHDSAAFESAFAGIIKAAYAELFDLHGEASWELDFDKLISFFRGNDQTSDVVGQRQASTFQALAGLAGHAAPTGQKSPTKAASSKKTRDTRVKAPKLKPRGPFPLADNAAPGAAGNPQREVGLTVRIEINLPVADDQETYDKIFRSIRENLIDGSQA